MLRFNLDISLQIDIVYFILSLVFLQFILGLNSDTPGCKRTSVHSRLIIHTNTIILVRPFPDEPKLKSIDLLNYFSAQDVDSSP